LNVIFKSIGRKKKLFSTGSLNKAVPEKGQESTEYVSEGRWKTFWAFTHSLKNCSHLWFFCAVL